MVILDVGYTTKEQVTGKEIDKEGLRGFYIFSKLLLQDEAINIIGELVHHATIGETVLVKLVCHRAFCQ